MNRRSILKTLLGGSVAAVIPVAANAATPAPSDRESKYVSADGRDWRILWTGWKGSQVSVTLAGQWVAFPYVGNVERHVGIYSACPGSVGIYLPGIQFNVCVQEHQQMIDYRTTGAQLESARKEAYDRLLVAVEGEAEANRTGDFSYRERLGIYVPYNYGVPVPSILA